MAYDFYPEDTQSQVEIKRWDVELAGDLPTGVTIDSVVATHIPPSGAATSPTALINGTIIQSKFGTLSVIGLHILQLLATYSDTQKCEVRFHIRVEH